MQVCPGLSPVAERMPIPPVSIVSPVCLGIHITAPSSPLLEASGCICGLTSRRLLPPFGCAHSRPLLYFCYRSHTDLVICLRRRNKQRTTLIPALRAVLRDTLCGSLQCVAAQVYLLNRTNLMDPMPALTLRYGCSQVDSASTVHQS